jgi:hypothetical protein
MGVRRDLPGVEGLEGLAGELLNSNSSSQLSCSSSWSSPRGALRWLSGTPARNLPPMVFREGVLLLLLTRGERRTGESVLSRKSSSQFSAVVSSTENDAFCGVVGSASVQFASFAAEMFIRSARTVGCGGCGRGGS